MLPINQRGENLPPSTCTLLAMNAALMDRVDKLEKTLADHHLRELTSKNFKQLEEIQTSGAFQHTIVVEVLEDFYSKEVMNQDAYIDGQLFRVRAIEAFAHSRPTDHLLGNLYQKGEKVALRGRRL